MNADILLLLNDYHAVSVYCSMPMIYYVTNSHLVWHELHYFYSDRLYSFRFVFS